MTGLQKQIEGRKNGAYVERNEKVSYSYISKLINKTHKNTKNRIIKNTLSVADAIKIYEALDFKPQDSYRVFKYLFSEIEGE